MSLLVLIALVVNCGCAAVSLATINRSRRLNKALLSQIGHNHAAQIALVEAKMQMAGAWDEFNAARGPKNTAPDIVEALLARDAQETKH